MEKKNFELKNKEMGLFVDGEFIASQGETWTDVTNPATGEVIAKVASGTPEDVDIAIVAAEKAFEAWRHVPVEERSELMLKIAETITNHEAYIANVETIDSGKPIVETIEDVRAIADQFKYFAGLIRAESGEFTKQSGQSLTMISREPLGVVGQIIPWNFPFLMAGWKLAPALAAGNCIVIKPAEITPLSILTLADLVKDILPKGVLNVVTGKGSVVGEHMVSHPNIRKIAFTGSTEVGMHISRVAADSVIPMTMELGGKSANIIFPDAPMTKAIEGAALAILYGQGQVCNAGSRLFVHRSVYKDVTEKLVALFASVKIGDPRDETTRLGTLISEKQLRSVEKYIEIGLNEGATLAYGGKRMIDDVFAKGHYMMPTLLTDVTNDMRVAREEIFGPVLVVIPFETEEDVIAMANDSDYGLAGACWTKDIVRGLRVANAVDTGLFWINEYHLAPSGTPFGGYKKSGYGRENHRSALSSYSQIKTVYISLTDEPTGWYA